MPSHETPLTRAMWQVHMRLGQRTDQKVDPEIAEEIACTAIVQYFATLAEQNTVRIGYEPRVGEQWATRPLYPADLKRMALQVLDAGFIGPCPPGKEPYDSWGAENDDLTEVLLTIE